MCMITCHMNFRLCHVSPFAYLYVQLSWSHTSVATVHYSRPSDQSLAPSTYGLPEKMSNPPWGSFCAHTHPWLSLVVIPWWAHSPMPRVVIPTWRRGPGISALAVTSSTVSYKVCTLHKPGFPCTTSTIHHSGWECPLCQVAAAPSSTHWSLN